MNREDIVRMAEEACNGKQLEYFNGWGVVFDHNQLETFANLVAAAEREACAKVCMDKWMEWMDSRVGNEILDNSNCPDAEDCAFAIRERGAP